MPSCCLQRLDKPLVVSRVVYSWLKVSNINVKQWTASMIDIFLSIPGSNQQLMASLVKCLKAVADSYNPAILDTTIPSNLFGSLVKLLGVKDAGKNLNTTRKA